MFCLYFDTIAQKVSTISALLICSYALRFGGKPERIGAVAILIAWFGTPLLQDQSKLFHVQISIFVLDAVLTTTLLALAFLTKRFWPLWAVSFQLLEILMHVAMFIDHKVHARAYFVGMEFWSYMVLLALAAGVWRETRLRPSLSRGINMA